MSALSASTRLLTCLPTSALERCLLGIDLEKDISTETAPTPLRETDNKHHLETRGPSRSRQSTLIWGQKQLLECTLSHPPLP